MGAVVVAAAPEVADVGRNQDPCRPDGDEPLSGLSDQLVGHRDGGGEAQQAENAEPEDPAVLVLPATESERQDGRGQDRPEQHPVEGLVVHERGRNTRARHEEDGRSDAVQGADRRAQDSDPIRVGSDTERSPASHVLSLEDSIGARITRPPPCGPRG